jgi:hypothetical protein
VEEAKKMWGNGSTQYQVRVLGEFPSQSDDTLIPLVQIETAGSTQPGLAPGHGTIFPFQGSDGTNKSRESASLSRATGRPLAGRDLGRSHAAPDRNAPITVGVDVARFGTDRTAFILTAAKDREA